MSLDFNRYPHLVSQIEVFPVTALPDELSESTKDWLTEGWDDEDEYRYQAYFRYAHPARRVDGYELEGHIDSVIDLTDYSGGITFWGSSLALRGLQIQLDSRLARDTYAWAPMVRENFDFTGNPEEATQQARLAVAGVFGYEPGLDVLLHERELSVQTSN